MSAQNNNNELKSGREPFMAFVADGDSASALENICITRNWPSSRVVRGGLTMALETLAGLETPELLVVDFSGETDLLEALAQLAGVCEPGVRVICLGDVNDVATYRALLDAGVEDYLLKPVTQSQLDEVIARVLDHSEEMVAAQPTPERGGEIIHVVGVRGGVGGSSVAQNLAWHYAHQCRLKTILVDLDLHFGTQALSLDLEAGRGFREAMENPSRMDSLFLERATVKIDDALHLMACESDLSQSIAFGDGALEVLLDHLGGLYDVVILDIPRGVYTEQVSDLAARGKTILVTDLSLVGMRDSLRLARFAKNNAQGMDQFVVASRCGENKERELGIKEFEKGIETSLTVQIPFDGKLFAKAEINGESLMAVEATSKPMDAIKELALIVLPDQMQEAEKQPFWRKFVSFG